MVDCVTFKDVELILKEIKIKMQIKRVKKEHILKYVMHGLNNTEGHKQKIITIKALKQQLIRKLKMDE
jgi:hypothetical protein